ncbi:hypothetical protein B0H13DRAFT_2061587 [Mycena leptocephala]|nr:hypothetical protein B0H13DRAFT_2061587 [Mycena leptocephala]
MPGESFPLLFRPHPPPARATSPSGPSLRCSHSSASPSSFRCVPQTLTFFPPGFTISRPCYRSPGRMHCQRGARGVTPCRGKERSLCCVCVGHAARPCLRRAGWMDCASGDRSGASAATGADFDEYAYRLRVDALHPLYRPSHSSPSPFPFPSSSRGSSPSSVFLPMLTLSSSTAPQR